MIVKNRLLVAVLLALASVSCVKEDYNIDKLSSSVDVTSSVALPIASGSIALEQVLPKSSDTTKYIYVDGDKLLHLVYKQTFDSLTFSKYANIVKDMQGSTSIAAPDGISFPLGTTSGQTSFSFTISLDRADQTLTEALLEGGLLSISSSATFYGSFSYTVESQDVVDANGENLKRSFNQSMSLSLAGCKIKPSGGKQISFKITYAITKQGSSTTNDKVTLSFGLSSLRISELVGNLGQISIPLQNNSLPLDFSDMVDNVGDFDIKNPQVKLIFRNQAVLPFAFSHSGVMATKDGQAYRITGLPSPINIYSPTYGVEKVRLSEAAIDPSSNLVSVLAKFPQKLNFNGSLVANPSSLPAVTNRINTKDKLYIGAAADLPLDVKLSNVVLKDTSSYDFSSVVKDSKSIDLMKLQFQFKNGFPLNLKVTAVIIDAAGNVLDNVFAAPFDVKSASTQNGKVVAATESKVEVSYNQARIQKLKAGDRIVFISTANTDGNSTGQTVKLLASYKVDIKVVGFIQANLNNL
ncbi:hypothetical protein [uncultured Acetobacteroides sp.]|uniref:hypothetical protein n=1 Tax=uncultured Acetobacteroides sp. TaxID=1760811 RepID=UPI0029F572C7|nr:hypothetical protein [uncultured Acetobacteroides sp.]